MKISQIQLFSYRLPLASPLLIGGIMSEFRNGLLLRMTTDSSLMAWGEIAPLEGLSQETVAQASSQVWAFRESLLSIKLPEAGSSFLDRLDRWLEPFQLLPSVRFALEMAALSALAVVHECEPAYLLNPVCGGAVAVNGVMNGSVDQIRAEASVMRRAGFSTVKLKVGRGSVAIDVDRVRMARAELGNDVTLRLDANRSWDLSAATMFCREIRDCNVEYTEEPLKEVIRLPELCERSDIRVALDESLMNLSPDSLRSFPGLAALILKPTLLGGIARTIRFSQRANQLQLATIISASVESSLGLAMLANLAAACGTAGAAHGLDTAKWLAQDLTQLQLRPASGRISLADAARAAKSLDLSGLTEVTNG